ncbi:MAG: cobalamin biosynthesis protein [Desulfitobacterium hafniense]|nr:cobalamin biosynthesis protein [Desulfitobacterium hafniense]
MRNENKLGILALTNDGLKIASHLYEKFGDSIIYIHESSCKDFADCKVRQKIKVFKHLRDIIHEVWSTHSSLIFIMATGIVVRQIASLISSKDRDPAVIVIDDLGKFVVPILSGHLGGANALARTIADQLQAIPVITTATDNRGFVAPDEYARILDWKVEDLKSLPSINRKLLEQGYLTLASEWELNPDHPLLKDSSYILTDKQEDADVVISAKTRARGVANKSSTYESVTHENVTHESVTYSSNLSLKLVPPVFSVGIGCRFGTPEKDIFTALRLAFDNLGIALKGIKVICSISLKQSEPGLVEAAKLLDVPFKTFPPEQIQEVNEQNGLVKSSFVREKIGVDGVCEAASLLGTQNGRLILPKLKVGPVTVAVSEERYL